MSVRCAIAGGGPAGIMLGLLLARAGVTVAVLEKHADFLRDFRGDTIHPSTLEVASELGLLDELLRRPHQELRTVAVHVAGATVPIGDFAHLPTRCKFLAIMPQWEFLDFLAGHARRFSTFDLRLETEVVDLIEEDGRVAGVHARTPQGPLELRADLVVAADGRHSIVRARAGLIVDDLGAPMDVLWIRLSKQPGDPAKALGYVAPGRLLVLIDRGDYWQAGFVIRKGGFEHVRRRGLDELRLAIATMVPFLGGRVHEITGWHDVKLLTVRVDRLRRWYRDGLLCIGDAAHAMSPIGGVGINLAIQDAVAAANLLASPLAAGRCSTRDLARVQRRRAWPTRVTQRAQLIAQRGVIEPVLAAEAIDRVPWPLRLLGRWPRLRRIPAWLVGLGVRPEHVSPALLHS